MNPRTRRLRRLRRRWGKTRLYPWMAGLQSLAWVKDNMVPMFWPVHFIRNAKGVFHLLPLRKS